MLYTYRSVVQIFCVLNFFEFKLVNPNLANRKKLGVKKKIKLISCLCIPWILSILCIKHVECMCWATSLIQKKYNKNWMWNKRRFLLFSSWFTKNYRLLRNLFYFININKPRKYIFFFWFLFMQQCSYGLYEEFWKIQCLKAMHKKFCVVRLNKYCHIKWLSTMCYTHC